MRELSPKGVVEAFENHDSVLQTDEGFEVMTAVFDGYVTATEGPKWKHTYTVTVYVPTLVEVFPFGTRYWI